MCALHQLTWLFLLLGLRLLLIATDVPEGSAARSTGTGCKRSARIAHHVGQIGTAEVAEWIAIAVAGSAAARSSCSTSTTTASTAWHLGRLLRRHLLLLRRTAHPAGHGEVLRHLGRSVLELRLHDRRVIVVRQRVVVDNANVLDVRATEEDVVVDLRLRRYLELGVPIFCTEGSH